MPWEPIRQLTTETHNSGAVELDLPSSASRFRPRDDIDSADDKPSKRRRRETNRTDELVETIKYWLNAGMISPERVVKEALNYDPELIGIVLAMFKNEKAADSTNQLILSPLSRRLPDIDSDVSN